MDLDEYKKDDLKKVQNEISDAFKTIQNFFKIQYTATASILVYSLSNGNPFTTLLPFFIIIPTYMLINGYEKAICRCSAYIIVFYSLEVAPEWELRLHNYRKNTYKKSDLTGNAYMLIYLTEILISFLAFLYTRSQYLSKLSTKPELLLGLIDECMVSTLSIYGVLFFCIIVAKVIYDRYVRNFSEEIDTCIEKWKKVHQEE